MRERLTGWLNSLTAKYVAVFVLLVAVPAIGISAYLLNSSYNDNKGALIHEQQEQARALAGRIDQAVEGIADRLGAVHGTGVSPAALEGILRPLLLGSFPPIEAYYVNAKGRTTGEVGSRSNLARLDAGPLAKARQGTFVGAVKTIDDFGDPRPVFVIATPESYGHGVVAEALDSTTFNDLLAETPVGDSYAYAVSAEGRVLDYPSKLLKSESGYLGFSDQSQVPERLRLHQVEEALDSTAPLGSATGENLKHRRVLSAWAIVPSTGWKVFVEQPESAAFAPLSSKIWKTALLIAAFVAAAVALSILLARRLVRPIKRLQVAAEAIGAGAYDERIELNRKDELGALATAFNQMAERVQELITGLERRVADRTKALEIASKHKSEFLANMSHELRTPLNAIVGFSQVLKQKLFGEVNQKQDEYLDDILSSADHLLALINDILDLSKVEAGQVELEVGLFSLREALERGVVMVRERASKSGVRLQLELDPAVDLVQGDERRIRQVVFNLLSNAVKFTPPGGRVEISTSRRNGEVLVAVADTGPGIAAEDQERIFEEFQQAQAGNGERPEGTGLGLALSRRLVELQGGRIWVESEPGKGSTFTFTVPAETSS
jgi:two-component system, NtrC family, sensor kinase